MIPGQRVISHLDLDSFFVSVECLRNTQLKGKPLLIGGKSDRAVVAACSYEARKFGVHSAMPLKLAKRLCPQALHIRGDYEHYSNYSRIVTGIIQEEVPTFEKASIDEFYIDLSGMEKHFGCSRFTQHVKQKITRQTGLPLSYGVASSKLVSKVATTEAKPNGHLEIPSGKEKTFLAPLPVEKLPLIGAKTGVLLRKMGVATIRTLSELPVELMTNLLGKNGLELWRRANGIDESPVVPYHEQKSISTETTFDTDTTDVSYMQAALVRMTQKIAFELRSGHKLTGCLTVKLRYADFTTVSRQCTLAYTCCDHLLLPKVKELFQKLYDKRLLVRLVGVRFSDLVAGSHQINLFEDREEMIKLYQALDSIHHRYGRFLVLRASGLL